MASQKKPNTAKSSSSSQPKSVVTAAQPKSEEPVPPDGGYGWVVLFASFVSSLVVLSLYLIFSHSNNLELMRFLWCLF
jgi:hypothetical protein